jgi:RND family efflux transporter MFP subunit
MKNRIIWLGGMMLVASLLAAGCKDSSAGKPEDTTINVETEQVRDADGSKIIAYSGTIEESESIPLSFESVGNVSKVLVNEGQAVKKGQLLAVLNDANMKHAYEMSLATLKQAEDAYGRLSPMYKNGNLPAVKMVEIETQLQQAKSAAAISKKSMDDCRLYAPVSGIVGKKGIDVGMGVIPGFAAITIVKIEKVFATISVAENEISSVQKGKKASVKIGALNNETVSGTVEEIGVMADPLSHTYKVKIAIQNGGGKLKPGMICETILESQAARSGCQISNQAVMVDEKGGKYVYAVDEGSSRAVRKYINTGRLLRDGVEITGGLSAGEQVVVTGQQKLTDNSPVKIVNRQ